ncbi:hypothetical protein DU508_23265 [Pedobacter chinensis]|uniref:Restriction endonuclease type II EcoRII N-terminal domain-containing protein n=1 Tax=Pedobacter chinensis TaxID=2282421 RepID=A0A369PS92_9SPHI|nr:EcoRII N-terminal effector-binding domain-containing protein [Pedobacter chinensis]RDC54155.1 hypothetical protein DU508_23265 [Pedobacter chinensis]
MNNLIVRAIEAWESSELKVFKYISPSDAGKSRGHQSGIYIQKDSGLFMFERPCKKGENRQKFASIKWQDGILIEASRFIYYGKGTRMSLESPVLKGKLMKQIFL